MAAGQIMRLATVDGEMKKYPEMKMEYLEIFREWVHKQPHLPHMEDGKETSILLLIHFQSLLFVIPLQSLTRHRAPNNLTFPTATKLCAVSPPNSASIALD